VSSGFRSLDGLLGGGFRRGDLIVLAGDTSSGKSALALAVALRAAVAGSAAAVLSAEMSPDRLMERAAALGARLSVDELRSGKLDAEARQAALEATGRVRAHGPVLASLSGSGASGVAHFLRDNPNVALAVIDPLEHLASVGNHDQGVAAAIRELKSLAVEHSLAILAVTRLRPWDQPGTPPRPRLTDLGGAGAIVQNADVVLGIFREELYEPHPSIEGATEVHVLKNRNGPTGLVDLYFYKQWLRFEDLSE
jgi:replicative DNA helicase